MKAQELSICFIAVVLLGLAAAALAAPADRAPSTYALVLSTQTVDPAGLYARNMRDWSDRFVGLLSGPAGVRPENVRVLAASADANAKPPVEQGTLKNVQAAFTALKQQLTPADQFILVILGHGTVTDPVGKLCLVGPDLKATELADLLDGLPTKKIVIINCASGAAEFLEKYSRPGRVVVSATGSLGEGNQTYFAEFFLLAYETKKADVNGDGVITVLEAFNRAAHQCINWYHRQYKIPEEKGKRSEGPRRVEVRTQEARRLFQKFYGGLKDVVMIEPPGGDDEDEDKDPDFEAIESLPLRREAAEHASLEDRGENNGAMHWFSNRHHVLSGKPGEQGELAARTVLGSPELPPPPR